MPIFQAAWTAMIVWENEFLDSLKIMPSMGLVYEGRLLVFDRGLNGYTQIATEALEARVQEFYGD
jgi:hypothetical protein